ncbi:succinate dehydrogenase assembly factor 1, mitochondrial [[Candida] jaroonii]|uniref:Succinate dehydrogenase assembly factor 1, mitochondrial n=1 Tax=[Candida] jaroonii TaxID=467808 RepID=A0ACA9Y6Y5_9ASCO|nr:succinate dehydrogenase assembly factor 1, mitochondrial [[Candida] jaroonii]
MKLSGLQKQVIHLYRSCMRQVKHKPIDTQHHWRKFIHAEFVKYKAIPKKQFSAIEHLLRSGDRRLEMFSNPQIKDIS